MGFKESNGIIRSNTYRYLTLVHVISMWIYFPRKPYMPVNSSYGAQIFTGKNMSMSTFYNMFA